MARRMSQREFEEFVIEAITTEFGTLNNQWDTQRVERIAQKVSSMREAQERSGGVQYGDGNVMNNVF